LQLIRFASLALSLIVGLSLPVMSLAAPGDQLLYSNFSNLNGWTVATSGGGNASIGNETSNQGRALRMRWGAATVTSNAFGALVPAAELYVWVRRGDDSFSENPEAGEDLFIEYLNSSGTWITLAQYAGNGTPGEILEPVFSLPADALHAALRIRFRTVGGSGSDFDYWHVDDPTVTERALPFTPMLGLGTCEDFENGLGNWAVVSSGGDAGTSSATFNSASNSLFTRGGAVSVTSNSIDLSGGVLVALELWIRRGDDSFSEDPDNNENFAVEWRVGGSAWTTLETFAGQGSNGEIFVRSYTLPGAAIQSDFQMRLRQTGGNSGNNDYWHVDDVCLTTQTPLFFSMEEAQWTGAAGEVEEGSGSGLNGTVFGGADNDGTTPALAGNPGTCSYADFDGVNDYIEIADAPEFDMPTAVTVAAWVNMRSLPSDLHTIVSKDTNYEFHINPAGQVYYWWNDSGGTVRNITTAAPISLNQWHHIAVTYESGAQRVYVDGAVAGASSYTGTLDTNDLPFYIGTDWNFIARAFDGYIDEVQLYPQALGATDVQALMLQTHDCATAAAQFVINHNNYGIHCVAETITVDVIDAVAGTPLLNYNASVQIDTQSSDGTWTLVSGGGAFNDASANDGVATYDWPLGESQAVFALSYLQGLPIIDIDVFQQSDSGIRDNDAEGNLVFTPSGFTLTAQPLGNPPPAVIDTFDDTQTAAIDFPLYIAAYGQTANDPQCGVIESYTGNKNLKFWSQYLNPGSGTQTFAIDGTAIAVNETLATNQTVVFNNGQASVAARYDDVGLKQVQVKDDTTINPELLGGIRGATAGFVVRPASFELSDIRNSAGSVLNPQAAGPSDAIFIAAGTQFRATVTALDADGDPTPNYGRETIAETVRLDVELFEPAGGAAPPVTAATGFDTFVSGAATGLDFVWNEVGIIRLRPAVGDADYLGAGDVSGFLSERIGRFVPSHFAVTQNAPLFATACTAGNFSYTGETFNYATAPVLTATAQSALNTTTLNYAGSYFKFATGALPARIYSATEALNLAAVPGSAADPAVSEIGPGIARLVFSAGGGLSFVKGAPTAPFDADIRLALDVIDSDGVAALANPQVFGAASGIPFNFGEEIRFGRIRMANAVGSERVNLALTMQAEYYAGAGVGFVANGDDSCSTNVSVVLSGFTENLAAGETCVLDSGWPGASGQGCAAPAVAGLQFAVPPVNGNFNFNLAAPGVGNTGGVTVTATVPDWLRFDWNAATLGEENPSGQATFGLFGGNARQIYLREIY
jgi:hypothetical protein